MKVIELFAGVGSQTQALKNVGIEHEVVGIAEIDKYAINSYMQLHGNTPLLGDITKIDSLSAADLWTYSFPCQDLSVAGLGKGIKIGTRSGLLFEVERLLENSTKPKYLLMENVKNLVGKKNKPDFDRWCNKLEELGYTNYWQVLNAKDFGVPQNRERVFMISILGEHKPYIFPDKKELGIRLKDVLEKEVEEKYYLKSEKAQLLKNDIIEKFDVKHNTGCDMSLKNAKVREIANCLMARYDSGVTSKQAEGTAVIIQVGNIVSTGNFKNPQRGRVYSSVGLGPALNCVGGGGQETKIVEPTIVVGSTQKNAYVGSTDNVSPTLTSAMGTGGGHVPMLIKEATKIGYKEAYPGDSINLEQPNSATRRGRVGNQVANTLLTNCNQGVVENNFRIRKLTPKECWRLMGWKDEQFHKIKNISNSQLYKQAGNGIVVNVLEEIFSNLLK
ncbi:MAG: DNA (cytosine-5-)-methyltransferase [Fusobacteriaceae bacterium]